MPGDYSRKIFNRANRYSGVLMQQGRVQLDADWNEQLDIQLYRTETESTDVIGRTGVPKTDDGFRIGVATAGTDLTIAKGRIYVDGLLCELHQPATYTAQPFYPKPAHTGPTGGSPASSLQLSLSDGTYLVYLDAWQREVTARERDHRLIREVALGGPDTTTRLQTIFQVRLLPVTGSLLSPLSSPPSSPLACETPVQAFDDATALTTGTLNARTQPLQNQANACLLPPSAGYTRLENQLYRVEVHTGGTRSQTTFKWSRNNASVESIIEKIDGNIITVAEVRKDELLGFQGLQWVEIVDDESVLDGPSNGLVQIDKIEGREITVKTSVASLAGRPGLRLRGWDHTDPAAGPGGISAATASWIDLEGGIQVQFSEGQYHAHDYWLIPARTVTGEIEWPPFEIPNVNPVPQPPRGIRHHYARLAIVEVFGGVPTARDCRKTFPALTEICAEDICFENDNCQLAGAATVQDALDRLCAERDLRFHKKHLHGWGIVCGLQVECGPDPSNQPRRHVTVKQGYAIDCDGNDVLLPQNDPIDIVSMIAASGLLAPTSPPSSPLGSPVTSPPGLRDGDVCLVLNSDPRGPRYSLAPHPGTSQGIRSMLEGTLLMDVFQDCIVSLVEFVTEQFSVPASEQNAPLVGPTAKRLTTFGNLLVQLANPENGSFVFLSGQRDATPADREDTILRDFYAKLRERLHSHTFCAMFENARQFPRYPYSGTGIETIFSKNFKSRFRVSPNGTRGYAVGAGTSIYVFDLTTNQMIEEIEFPGGTSAIVQDVAFSPNGQQVYAVATIANRDSMFAVADVANNTHTFRANPTMICDVLLVTLATSQATPTSVYAIGRGTGLYDINPQNVNPTPAPIYPFNAVGHLVIHEASRNAFATVGTGTLPVSYTNVVRLNLATVQPNVQPAFTAAGRDQAGAIVFITGEDDIFVPQVTSPRLFIVSGASSGAVQKQIAVYDALAAGGSSSPLNIVDLGENTGIRLAHNPVTGSMMVTFEDSYRVGLITPNFTLDQTFRQPVQISPRGILYAPQTQRVYVLNYVSNTITSIPAARLQPSQQLPLQDLVDYRTGVINAFADLLGGLLQYLKDCFCDHLLVDCPTCDEDDKLYLACITIRNGQVQKICNFSHRKYVHSFPTWEYWLSVVPILPMLRFAIERLCCAALPSLFNRFQAPQAKNSPLVVSPGANAISGQQMHQTVTFAQTTDFRGVVRDGRSTLRSGAPLAQQLFASRTENTLRPRTTGLMQSDIVNRSADEAKQKLESSKVQVQAVEVFDPSAGAAHLARFATAPERLEEGAQVTLVTDRTGKVLYYKRTEQPSPEITALRTDIDQVRTQVTTLGDTRPEITALRARIDANTAAVTAAQVALQENQQLKQEIASLRADLATVRQQQQQQVAVHDAAITELRTQNKELQASTADTVRKLQDQVSRLRPNQ